MSIMGLIGAILAILSLGGIALLAWPVSVSNAAIVSGVTRLNANDLSQYQAFWAKSFPIDFAFLVGSLLAWIGLAKLISADSRLLAAVVLALGGAAVIADLCENEMMWSVVLSDFSGSARQIGFLEWDITRRLSYTVGYFAASIVAFFLFEAGKLERVIAICTIIATAIALPGLYGIESLKVATFTWYFVWFLGLAILFSAELHRKRTN